MHLSPEQIDRQPFRMRRRGYDVVQVRNFLREIAQEMRARQEVRERLATGGDPDELMSRDARDIIDRAEAEAERTVRAAEAAAAARAEAAGHEAEDIVGSARQEAATIIDAAEQTARERSAAVLAETQSRLDQLLAAERELHKAPAAGSLRDDEPEPAVVPGDHPVPDTAPTDAELADFMKDTLRNEIRPE